MSNISSLFPKVSLDILSSIADLQKYPTSLRKNKAVYDQEGKLIALGIQDYQGTELVLGENEKHLQYLNISGNPHNKKGNLPLLSLIFEVAMPDLALCYLNHCALESLHFPAGFRKLRQLYVQKNRLTSLTFGGEMPALQVLDVSNNLLENIEPLLPFIQKQVADVQPKIGEDVRVFLGENPVSKPPKEIVEQGYAAIVLHFAQLEKEQEILAPYINDEVKLILIGNSDAGKSTLSWALRNDREFKQVASTHWMEIEAWETLVNGKNVKIRIFDFGGQEYYHDTHHLFLSNNTAYLLLWDAESNRMFERDIAQQFVYESQKVEVKLQCYPLHYWLDAIEHFTNNDYPYLQIDAGKGSIDMTILAIEKKAQVESIEKSLLEYEKIIGVENMEKRGEELEQEHMKRIVEMEAVLKAELNDFESYRKSNKTYTTNPPKVLIVQNKVDSPEKRAFLPQQALKEKYPFIYDFLAVSVRENKRLDLLEDSLSEMLGTMPMLAHELPGITGIIKEKIEDLQGIEKDNLITSLAGFEKLANKWIKADKRLKNHPKVKDILLAQPYTGILAQYLADIGRILYFPKNANLADKLYLNPAKVIQKIYTILLRLHEKGGEFDNKHIQQCQDKAQTGQLDAEDADLVKLMQHFKIIFQHPQNAETTYIAPLYLPVEPLAAVALFLSASPLPICRFQYEGFIHKSVVLDFFQEYGAKAFHEKTATGEHLFYYWRNGIVLKEKDEMLLVRFFMGDEQQAAHIDVVRLNESKSHQFSHEVINYLTTIHRTWKKVVKEVPSKNGYFLPLREIIEAEKKQLWVFQDKKKGLRFELQDFAAHLKGTYLRKKVFISYSQKDSEYLTQLEAHLALFKRQQLIVTWSDRKLEAGVEWDRTIRKELAEADVILLLVSPDFLATDYIWDVEVQTAMQRHERKEAKVVPIILRPCLWKDLTQNHTHFSKLNALPSKAKPLTKWDNPDEAWTSVALALKDVLKGN